MADIDTTPSAMGWRDLTVPNADAIATFYEEVAGWTRAEHPMSDSDGEYVDYVMFDSAGNVVGGLCHRRGPNAGLPSVWMNYVNVADADVAAHAVVEAGGEVLEGPRAMGGGKVCVIRDPAGAALALFEHGPPARADGDADPRVG